MVEWIPFGNWNRKYYWKRERSTKSKGYSEEHMLNGMWTWRKWGVRVCLGEVFLKDVSHAGALILVDQISEMGERKDAGWRSQNQTLKPSGCAVTLHWVRSLEALTLRVHGYRSLLFSLINFLMIFSLLKHILSALTSRLSQLSAFPILI